MGYLGTSRYHLLWIVQKQNLWCLTDNIQLNSQDTHQIDQLIQIMKASTIKYTRISVRGTTNPNFHNETKTNFITIHQDSSKMTILPVRHSRTTTRTSKPGKIVPKRGAPSSPPPPPQTRRTIQHIALQLEYRILHHSGYIPKGAVPIAFFQRRSVKSDSAKNVKTI